MKFMVCGSMTFAKQMIDHQQEFKNLGFEAKIPTVAHDINQGNRLF